LTSLERGREMTSTLECSMQIQYVATEALSSHDLSEILAMGTAAYEEDVAPFLSDCGPGLHALGRVSGAIVTHALIVDRRLQIEGRTPLHAAYIELVATDPPHQGKGYASTLLRALVSQLANHEIAGLSPSAAAFYERLGWELWRGPLFVRTEAGLESSPEDEEVMILRLPRTPEDVDLDASLSVEWRPGEVW
jgi:aminoglycoside 2'-N-acetyltransferase I